MTRHIDLSGRVAIVTGAGGGLGKAHALALASRGAKVVVNDLGGGVNGEGGSLGAANAVVAEIRARGGEAIANGASVTDETAVGAMIDEALARWGRIDILVNNAGILRDRTFARQTLEDFRAVVDVHLMGSVTCTKAVWATMREQGRGRIIMTTSSSGLYGNFGQAAYSAAKLALVGLMHTLHLEGAKHDIRVNCLSPSAATRMTETVYGDELLGKLDASAVSNGVLALVSEDAPSRSILCAGAGSFERAYVTLTEGVFIGGGTDAPERLLSLYDQVSDRSREFVPQSGPEQSHHEQSRMSRGLGVAGGS